MAKSKSFNSNNLYFDSSDSHGVISPHGQNTMTESHLDECNNLLNENHKEDWHSKNAKRVKRRPKQKRKNKKQSGDESSLSSDFYERIPEIIDLTSGFKQFMTNVPDFWEAVRTHSLFSQSDVLLSYIEGVTQLAIIVTRCDDTPSRVAAVLLYAKTLVKSKSLLGTIKDYVEELFVAPQSDSVDMLRECRTNWNLFKRNKLFTKFSSLLTLLVSLGICDATSLEFSIGGLKMVESRALEVQLNAFDITDAILDTLAFFIEGGMRCYKVGSLKPLLFDDYRVYAIDENYIDVCQMWDLERNGNLLNMRGIQSSEFDNKLENTISDLKQMLPSFSGLDKKLLTDKYNKLVSIKNDFILSKISGGTRKAPFSIELFGKSSQGKTTFGDQIVDRLLVSANLPTCKTRRAAINASSKFMDTWKSDHLVAVLDDMCNEKSNFVEKPPTRWVIDICNNQTFYAPKAEIEAKGKVFVEPEIVVINTNKKDLDSYAYSNCPYSIQRRAHLVVTVKAKSQFQNIHDGVECGLSTQKVLEFYNGDEPPVLEDLWDLDVEVAVQPGRLSETADYAPYIYNGKEMTGIGSNEFAEMCIDLYSGHREQQQTILDKNKKVEFNCRTCGIDGCKNIPGQCTIHSDYVSLPSYKASDPVEVDMDDYDEVEDNPRYSSWEFGYGLTRPYKKQFGEGVANAIYTFQEKVQRNLYDELDVMDSLATKTTYLALDKLMSNWSWLKLIPDPLYDQPFVNSFLKAYYREHNAARVNIALRSTYSILFALSMIILLCAPHCWPSVVFMITITLLYTRKVYAIVESQSYACLREKSRITIPMLERFKNDNYKRIAAAAGVVTAIMALRHVYKAYMSITPKQGNIVSPSQEDIVQRDSEENPYIEVYRRPLPIVDWGRHVTSKQMSDILSKNLLYGTVQVANRNIAVNCLMLCTNYMVIPKHYFLEDSFTVIMRRNNPHTLGGKYKVRVERYNTFFFDHLDLAIVYVAEGGSYKDITKLFLQDRPTDHVFSMKWRTANGDFIDATGLAKANAACSNGDSFPGVEYGNLSIKTFSGLCGAPIFSMGVGCNITGFHVGGLDGTPRGCACSLMASEINLAISHLSSQILCPRTASDGVFRKQSLGVEMVDNSDLHPKSPINYLPPNSTILYLGSCIGKTTSHTDVRRTLISSIIEQEMGVPNKWNPPKMKPEYWGWQNCLANISEPGESLPYKLLAKSVDDYITPLKAIIENSDYWKRMRPLGDDENLLGIPGRKFIDAIKKNTSIGFPLTGPKRRHLLELESTETYPHNFTFTKEIMDEIQYAEDQYKRGLRAYPIAKACKKDEVLAKEKCRIFYGNAISMTWLIRKYYLPLIRFLQMHPLLSECAVGINCHSQEWDQMYTHITKFDRLIGGDYKKYDQKIPSQMIITSFNVLITLAELCDYDEGDISVMRAMIADVAYAYVAFNGDLIGLVSGTHISGNSLTVIVNGICGALNLRSCFYAYNSHSLKYRDYVAIMTYGDDNLGSCSPDINFSIKLISDFLAQYGQTYTMPNKSDTISDYLPSEDFEFLKRKTVFIPEINTHVGALEEDSIMKSLHMYIRGKHCENSEIEACALNIEGAAREYFNHGRKIYDERIRALSNVAVIANMRHFCPELDVTFDQRVEIWKEKYIPGYQSSDMTIKGLPRMTHGVVEAVEDVPSGLVTSSC